MASMMEVQKRREYNRMVSDKRDNAARRAVMWSDMARRSQDEEVRRECEQNADDARQEAYNWSVMAV